MLTVATTAKLLNASRNTVYRLIRNGTLPAQNLGPSIGWRLPEGPVRKYLEGEFQPGTNPSPPAALEDFEYVTVQEVSRDLGYSTRTVLRLIHAGRLGARKNPGRNGAFRVPRATLDAFRDELEFQADEYGVPGAEAA